MVDEPPTDVQVDLSESRSVAAPPVPASVSPVADSRDDSDDLDDVLTLPLQSFRRPPGTARRLGCVADEHCSDPATWLCAV